MRQGSTSAERSELRRHWPAVLACFASALFAWGFGFYGLSVYVAELQRLRGWSSSLVASAVTAYYLLGAMLLTRVHLAIARFGSRAVLVGGASLLALGATQFSRSTEPWHLAPAAILLAIGWAGTSTTAIATTLAASFDRQRGLAISLALNGASAAGFTVAPALIALSAWRGVSEAVPALALAMLVVLVPLVVLAIRPSAPLARLGPVDMAEDERAAYRTTSEAVRDPRVWSVALPFALALAAQVGIIVHLVAILQPRLGTGGTAAAVALVAGAAMVGRLLLGLVIDRLDGRRVAAASFASQAGALALLLALPGSPAGAYAACLVFGLSVGNVITLPSLVVGREVAPASFGLVLGLTTAIGQVTFAFAPGLLGILRDLTGDYAAAVFLCLALDAVAALLVLRRPAPLARDGRMRR